VRVVAQIELLDRDARELLLALAQVVEGGLRDVGLDRHVRVRRLGHALDHALVHRAGADADHARQAAVEGTDLRLLRGQCGDRHGRGGAGGARQAAPFATLGAGGAAAVLAQLAVQAAQARGGLQPLSLDPGAGGAVVVGELEHGLGQLARHDLNDRGDARADQQAAVAVHDVAARRLDAHLAHPVLARLADVVLAREHLQEPQPEEHDREQHEREAAQQRHAQRELRRDGGSPLFEGRRH
jgi:hypothetical protein